MVLAGSVVFAPHFPSFELTPCIVAVLRGESSVSGVVQFEQTSESAPTKITYELAGLDPSSKRGFHVQYTPPFTPFNIVPLETIQTDVSLPVPLF
jgi:hypothetical protein